MASIGDVSVSHITSSLAQNIATSEPATTRSTADNSDVTLASAMKGAFDGLFQSHQSASGRPSSDSLVAPIAPFSVPPISNDKLMSALNEAVGAFNQLSGQKQNASQQLTSPVGDQQLAQLPGQQHVAILGDQQLAQLSDKQRSANLGDQQLAQLSDKQFSVPIGDQQLAQLSDKQRGPSLGDQQLAQLSDKQLPLAVGDKQLPHSLPADRPLSTDKGTRLLDQCTNFFSLLQTFVSGDHDLAAKTRGILR